MGIENNECVIATTYSDKYVKEINEFINVLSEKEQKLFAVIPGLINNKTTIVLAPSGSKKGWELDKDIEALRNEFVQVLKEFDFEDGSNPFDWVEVGYGEFGQKILRGNCRNMYDDRDYAV